jgi:ATP-dependent helicase Lhr and Lhr-like helicase
MDLPFSTPTARWFQDSFAGPTPVQARGWPVIAGGAHALLLAPTGSGKTLAAFLVGIDRCLGLPQDVPDGVRVLYVSPLKALVYDVERNLRAPLMGVQRAAPEGTRRIQVDLRTGDTPQADRRRFQRSPGDILVTTPESLYLLLTSNARAALETVHTVIVDEIHAIAGSKRGVHLALSLERLDAVTAQPVQRVGLSATVRPVEAVAHFLGGPERDVTVVDTAAPPRIDLQIVVPVPDMDRPILEAPAGGPSALERASQDEPSVGGRDPAALDAPFDLDDPFGDDLGADFGGGSLHGTRQSAREVGSSVWPAIHPRLLELVRAHRTTLVFANSRVLTERLCNKLNELAGEEIAKAHHGSISHARRTEIEDDLKSGRIPCIVATSSLELGIDMGAIDLVIQVESPGSAARGLQRIGRAGHQVGGVSKGRIFPKYKGDLLEAAVVAARMAEGVLEPLHLPLNCLDVLAQQVVAMVALEPGLSVTELHARVRRAAPYAQLSLDALVAVLDMLSGRYPSDDFADLRPRIAWDRATDTLKPRKGARMLAVLNAGTIPDRGTYGVFLPDGPRIGELDEEMVYESREGDTIILGASTWRIEEITRDRVTVTPAPGEPGRMPFWRGEGPGRPLALGEALGAFLRELSEQPVETRADWVRERVPLDDHAIGNLLDHVEAQREATGTLPTDRAITVEAFRDEIGDWRVCILTPFGGRVHAPWALGIQRRLSETSGFEVQCMWTDDGVVLRFAEAEELPDLDALFLDPDELEALVTDEVRTSALFQSRFREAAGRALLLPRKRPGKRTPLWAQRRRGETLLAVASRFPSFPILLEAYRECLQDVFDLPALQGILRGIRERRIRVDVVETRQASPFAKGLVFAWVSTYLYETDTPLAERRAQALTLDRSLLRELLGQDELRDLLDPGAVARVEAELGWRTEDRRARDADEVHDLLRRLGDRTTEEIAARSTDPDAVEGWLATLEEARRAAPVRIAGEARWIAAEDAGRYRDALGTMPPPGLPSDFLAPAEAPLESLLLRWARTHGPFLPEGPARRWGLPTAVVASVLRALVQQGTLLEGELRPGGTRREICHPDVLRRLKRASLAALRDEVAAVDATALARFLPGWHGLSEVRPRGVRQGMERLREVVAQLEGLPIPFSALESVVLPARVPGFQPVQLDQLGAMGELVWVGRGALGRKDGKVALLRREAAPELLPPPPEDPPDGPIHVALREHLEQRGASFLAELVAAVPQSTTTEVVGALWDLVWAGLVTNDTFQPLRGLGQSTGRRGRAGRRGLAVAGGRWALTARLVLEPASPTERVHAIALGLLERYGVVAREMAHAEDVPNGFVDVYKVLRAMEEAGQVRRGYFVEGLGGAQFALPGAIDRLRAFREEGDDEVVVLAATDPAQVWGGVLSWPAGTVEGARPRRVPGAAVVLVDGRLVLFVDKGGRTAWTFPGGAPEAVERAAAALGPRAALVGARTFRIDTLDGVTAREAPAAGAFQRAGWVPDHKGLGFVGGP